MDEVLFLHSTGTTVMGAPSQQDITVAVRYLHATCTHDCQNLNHDIGFLGLCGTTDQDMPGWQDPWVSSPQQYNPVKSTNRQCLT